MNARWFFLALGLLLVACRKESIPPFLPAVADNIAYHEFVPTALIHSIDTFLPDPSPQGYGDFPMPGDSVASLKLDIDGDGLADFGVVAAHSVDNYSGSGSNHFAPMSFSIDISGIQAGDSIVSQKPNNVWVPVPHDTLNHRLIDSLGTWQPAAMLYLFSQNWMFPNYAQFSETYVGIKIHDMYGWIHLAPAPLNGVFIYEYALNLTPGNSILAGQRQ